MLFGCSGCSLCFAVTAIGLGIGTKAANGVAVAFIFLFYFFYVSAMAMLAGGERLTRVGNVIDDDWLSLSLRDQQ